MGWLEGKKVLLSHCCQRNSILQKNKNMGGPKNIWFGSFYVIHCQCIFLRSLIFLYPKSEPPTELKLHCNYWMVRVLTRMQNVMYLFINLQKIQKSYDQSVSVKCETNYFFICCIRFVRLQWQKHEASNSLHLHLFVHLVPGTHISLPPVFLLLPITSLPCVFNTLTDKHFDFQPLFSSHLHCFGLSGVWVGLKSHDVYDAAYGSKWLSHY